MRFAQQCLRVGLVAVEERVFHVRPEFLHHLRESVRGAGDAKAFDIIANGARVRIVSVGYRDGSALFPKPFREIELLATFYPSG